MELYTYQVTVDRVVDGDTLDITIDLGFKVFVRERVRLHGIDTPETYGVKKGSAEYEAGMAATDFVKTWMDNNGWEAQIRSHDGKALGTGKYGRWVVEVFNKDGEVLNTLLVKEGHAVEKDY